MTYPPPSYGPPPPPPKSNSWIIWLVIGVIGVLCCLPGAVFVAADPAGTARVVKTVLSALGLSD